MASPDNPEQPQPQPASVSKPEPRQPSWLARVAHRAGAFLLPHTRVRRLGEAWVDLCCAAADGVIARGARWLPWLAHAHGLTDRAKQASFVLFHAPYAEMAGYLEMKDKECDAERRDAVLLRFQLQELRGRLAAREAAIAELQWVSTGHDRLQERNGELVQELNRLTGDHKADLAARDDEILRLGLRSDKLKVRSWFVPLRPGISIDEDWTRREISPMPQKRSGGSSTRKTRRSRSSENR